MADEGNSEFRPAPLGALPGKFTVDAEGKQVYFSKGNLYWNGSEYCFEAYQYTVNTESGNETENHVAHFYWSKDADVARAISNYSDTHPEGNDVFFADRPESFEVARIKGWRVLTGGDNGEWRFLIDRKDGALCKSRVKVCGSENSLILLPDDWKWGEDGVGTGWQNEYSEKTTVKWSTMEAAGAVCLPAAGYRNGVPYYYDPAGVCLIGGYGIYWSSTPCGSSDAYDLEFNSGNVSPSDYDNRGLAYSVRLVTDVK